MSMTMTRPGPHLKQQVKMQSSENRGLGSKSIARSQLGNGNAPHKHEHGSQSMHNSSDPAETALYVTNSVEEWLDSENLDYQGMLVQRSPSWGDNQEWIDRVAKAGVYGLNESIKCHVWNGRREDLVPRLQEAGKELLEISRLRGGAVPEPLGAQIKQDIVDIGTAVGVLTSELPHIQVGLEFQGNNVCARWHRDDYVGRAIVTYTGMDGTTYTCQSNVNMWELQNCGNNECVTYDKSKITSAGIGDILFIKGRKFPRGQTGLVHKAPEKSFHSDGSVMTRLTLKIDVLPADDE
eukprot:TRINITY_DN18986_c0_g1_i2.p1 TRINITY_DN18986_c0_g1~~TRINITY_DN18986_c0_g1_i2.p1  ORF type:complete len:337 (+),score=21.51 TRINITY_DN18986_c0_g1_i2:131-1012(+)